MRFEAGESIPAQVSAFVKPAPFGEKVNNKTVDGIGVVVLFRGNSYPGHIGHIAIRLGVNPYMFPRITGYEFIRFALSAKNRKEDKQKMLKFNQLFELPLHKYAENYSTGMLKKLHLLALFLQENDLLLLDEPFNGLDIQSAAYLSEILKEIKCFGSVILVSSHDISHLLRISGTLTTLENGNAYFRTESLSDIEKEYQREAEEKVKNLFSTT